ncbi:hypothetical protein PACTADRAFT_52218 [Pachysolen tannophilus NRRL Y-2460]|uniref:Urea carboxylase n=1 Tax=Pachysolen tannophilus NRRL Y-2460 TaxID=669874 RepID=A0A1E4U0F1_PACTA|nr:hypothetical protein PACTADRAFT_52218 [Pachysolen tannophilus NRRL Y-2460]
MLKATAGGGGMGLKVCYEEAELKSNFQEVQSRGESLFKNTGVFLEKYVENGRHIEIQVFGNGKGDVMAFGERECSIQRRHQKVVEEAPSPFIELPDYNNKSLRKNLSECAIRLASSMNYKSAGTVEFLVDNDSGDYYFLEMNTRLQVEHGITELIYGLDLVYMMLLQAEYEAKGQVGIPLSIMKEQCTFDVDENGVAIPQGHAIECRVYAENPIRNFQPSPGILHNVEFPSITEFKDFKIRIDHWISTGAKISPYFDPLLAKVMVWGKTRKIATSGMVDVLNSIKIQGPPTNVEYLKEILNSFEYQNGLTLTSFLNKSFNFRPHLMEFEEGGAYTSIQDLPGREKSNGGVPLSGPVDPLCLQIANIIVGNDMNTEGLEISLRGPVIKFHSTAVIALTGGEFEFKIDGKDVPMYTALTVPAGCVVTIGETSNQGSKSYLSIQGGFPGVAYYLGSKSCTPTLGLGGHQGRVVFTGDCLEIDPKDEIKELALGYSLPIKCRPVFSLDENHVWTIRMLRGPHDSEEICSDEGLKQLYNTVYHVNLNSNRGAIKLDGPPMIFSRNSGGDGGAHPSNILEYPYPTCGLSAVGSGLVLFGVDGATLSGFTCVSVPAEADWWKFGQAKIGSGIRFELITYEDSRKLSEQRTKFLKYLCSFPTDLDAVPFDDSLAIYDKNISSPILYRSADASKDLPQVTFRQAGEKMIILDFSIDHFTLLNNGRQRALELEIESSNDNDLKDGLIRYESATGAMAFVFDPSKISRKVLLQKLIDLESKIPPIDKLKIPSKIYKLPICFDHSALRHCIERYMHSQRPYASYLPDNTKFVMKASCIETIEDFKDKIIGKPEIITAASFLCANTLIAHPDPRMRFMTQKYNPARTFTPRGAVGTGAVGHSIYSVDSPGGYMIWGMTLPNICWDTFSRIQDFGGKPWFFKNFDQIEFYEVNEPQLAELNNELITGELKIHTKESLFDFEEYTKFLESIAEEAAILKQRQIKACEELTKVENKLWDQWMHEKSLAKASKNSDLNLLNDPNNIQVQSSMAANIFKVNVKKGDKVTKDDVLIVLEAMKMEIAVRIKTKKEAKFYEILEIIVDEGDMVNPGDCLAIVKEST